RGMQVEKALGILEHHPQHNATPLAKLLRSAISNWQQSNTDKNAADANLIVKTVFVDGGRTLKRMRPAPQGRGYRVRKRSNHVTIIVDYPVFDEEELIDEVEEEQEAAEVEEMVEEFEELAEESGEEIKDRPKKKTPKKSAAKKTKAAPKKKAAKKKGTKKK